MVGRFAILPAVAIIVSSAAFIVAEGALAASVFNGDVYESPLTTLELGWNDAGMLGYAENPNVETPSGEYLTGLRYRPVPGVQEYEFGPRMRWGVATDLGASTGIHGCHFIGGGCSFDANLVNDPPTPAPGLVTTHNRLLDSGGADVLTIDQTVRNGPAPYAEVMFEVEVTVTNVASAPMDGIVYRIHQVITGDPTGGTSGGNGAVAHQGQNWLRFDGTVTPPPPALLATTNNWMPDGDPSLDLLAPAPASWNCFGAGVGVVEGPGNTALSPWATAPTPGYTGWFGACKNSVGLDFLVGDILPGEERRFWMYITGGPDFDTVDSALHDIEADFWYITNGNQNPPSNGAPATFAWAFKGFIPPDVDFGWTSADGTTPCAGTPVTFEDFSTPRQDGTLKRSRWEFGDGQSTDLNPWSSSTTHAYTAPGIYSVTLTVWDDLGSQATVTKPILVEDCTPPNLPPIINVPCAYGAVGETMTFYVTASDPNTASDPPEFSTLTLSAKGMPQGGSFDPATGKFTWLVGQGSAADLVFRVEDGGSPPLSDEEPSCIEAYVPPGSPEQSDADGDGVPDGQDNCPWTPNPDQMDADNNGMGAECGGDPAPPEEDPEPEPSQFPPAPCSVEERPRNVTAQREGDVVRITWEAPETCELDRFLVWNGTGNSRVASVAYDPGSTSYSVVDESPWSAAHRYYVQGIASGPDIFVFPHAVASDMVPENPAPCTVDCGPSTTPLAIQEQGTPETRSSVPVLPWLGLLVLLLVGGLLFFLWRRRREDA